MGKRYNSFDFENDRDDCNYYNDSSNDDLEEKFERKHRERNLRDFRKDRRKQKETW